MGPLRPDFPKWTSSSGNLRKKSSESVGKGWGRVGKARREKGGRSGWGMARKKEGGVGRCVGDDVIKKKK